MEPATDNAGTQKDGFARWSPHSILLVRLHLQKGTTEALQQERDLLLDILHQQWHCSTVLLSELVSKISTEDQKNKRIVWERARGTSSFAWLHSLVIFIEWMAASNVLVFVGRQLLLLESFLPFALCATSLLSVIALSLPILMSLALRVSDSQWALTLSLPIVAEPRSMLSPIVMSLVDTTFLLSRT